MMQLHIDDSAQIPIYEQLKEQVKQLIATSQLQPGERLPTVRQLAHSLRINPGTVARAYRELEQEGVVASRRGGGTIAAARADDPSMLIMRQTRLSHMVSGHILETLSLGYSPEEIEAAFSLHLSRWREERRTTEKAPAPRHRGVSARNTITIVASHDLALNLLVSKVKERKSDIHIELVYAGSLGGLIALQEDRADLAGIHLLDEETGEYNYPYVKHLLPGREMAVVNLSYRVQGLLFAKNNPKEIKGIDDLRRHDIALVNRQRGSGTRVLLDLKLRQHGITPSEVEGYNREVDTHLAVATSISRGEADVGLGIEAAARTCDLGFLPLSSEKYDLVIPTEKYRSALLSPLLEIVSSEDFRNVVTEVGGYDTSHTGSTIFLP